MKLLDIIAAPWAILPDRLIEIREIYLTHLRGEKVDIKGIETQLGRPLNNETKGYEIIDGVAVIPIEGVVAKRMNLLQKISGGTSTELAARDFKEAVSDPSVNAIILSIDSPGGSVDGTQEFARLVHSSRGVKPVASYASGMMASAAYWIGAAAEHIYISGDTTQVGSIGVVATHVDVSRAEEMSGIKTTEIVAGRYKRIASQYQPLSDEGRATIQDMVDYVYSAFVGDVSTFRGVPVDKVLYGMADGKIFIGEQAIGVGLVDGVSTLDGLIARMTAGVAARRSVMVTEDVNLLIAKEDKRMAEEQVITKEIITSKYPDIAEAFRREGFDKGVEDGKATGMEDGRKLGADTERDRIRAVEEQLIPGHEVLIHALKFDGKTTGPEAAVRVLNAERQSREKRLSDIEADSPEPVPQPAVGEDAKILDPESKKDKIISGIMRDRGISYRDAALIAASEHPDIFKGGR